MQIKQAAPLIDSASEWAKYTQAVWDDTDNIARKNASRKAVDYYKANQEGYLIKEIHKIFSDPIAANMKRKWVQNVTKQIIDSLAICYSGKVRRDIKAGKRAREIIDQKILKSLNRSMATANKWILLDRTSVIYARWSNKRERVDYKTYNQFNFDLVFDKESDEKELKAVILSDFVAYDEANIHIYTENKRYHFIGGELQSEIIHDFGVLPFEVIYAEDPGFDDYLFPRLDLINANLELNLAMSNLLNMLQSQAHGILILKTAPDDVQPGNNSADPNDPYPNPAESDRRLPIHDPGNVLHLQYGVLGEEPKLESLDQHADFSGSVDSIRYLLNSLANSFGIDIGVFDITAVAKPATGLHITEKTKQTMIDEMRQNFIDAETDLFQKSYLIASFSDQTIPKIDTKSFTMEFVPSKSIVDNMTVTDVVTMMNNKIIDKTEVVRTIYPGLSRSEAEAFIQEMGLDEILEQALPEQPEVEEIPTDETEA